MGPNSPDAAAVNASMMPRRQLTSLAAFQKFQAFLRESTSFAKARACVSVLGNHFTTNDILQSIRLVRVRLHWLIAVAHGS